MSFNNSNGHGQQEVDEILAILPSLSGKDVLEIGGTERVITNRLEGNITHLTGCKNIKERVKDNYYDLIFTNCLFMHMLNENDIQSFLEHALSILKPDGHLFFSETCFEQPNDAKSSSEVKYRKTEVYNSLIESAVYQSNETKACYVFETVISKSIQSGTKFLLLCMCKQVDSNRHQICWLLKRTQSSENDNFGFKTFQEFLNKKQYTRTGILRYERIFGQDFISTGGIDTTLEFVKYLDLQPGQHVLDVGTGIGGGAFYMEKEFGVQVTGIDLSSNMVDIAMERSIERKTNLVNFEVCDATKRVYQPSSFDVVYSRDTILHIAEKDKLFTSFLNWLKPGGRLLISDYCCTDAEWSPDYAAYVKQRGYILLSVKDYGKLLENVGFENVRAEDRTDQFVEMLRKELVRIENEKEDFLTHFSIEDYDALVVGWKDKLKRCANGDQKWGLFIASKPI